MSSAAPSHRISSASPLPAPRSTSRPTPPHALWRRCWHLAALRVLLHLAQAFHERLTPHRRDEQLLDTIRVTVSHHAETERHVRLSLFDRAHQIFVPLDGMSLTPTIMSPSLIPPGRSPGPRGRKTQRFC